MADYNKANFLTWIQDSESRILSEFGSIASSDFQYDEMAKLVQALSDAEGVVRNMPAGHGNNLKEVLSDISTKLGNKFDKTSDDDKDLPVAGSFTNFSGTDLRTILNGIDSAVSGKSSSDTTASTGISFDNTDVSSITTADDVHQALDEIYGTLGMNDPANDFDNTYNYLENLSTLKAAFTKLDGEIKNNYRSIAGVRGDIAYRETLWNQKDIETADGATPSITEISTTSTSEQTICHLTFWKGSTDDEIIVRFKGDGDGSSPAGHVKGEISGESVSAGRYIAESTAYRDYYLPSIVISDLENGLYTLELKYKSISGNTVKVTNFNVIKKG